jgi:5-methylcytosine-specific restriction protein A
MPKKPLKPCSYPGCPNLTEGRYCEEHKKLREKQYNKYHRDKVVQSIYNSKEWKMLRRKKLELNPECEQCLREDRITRATMVDHIVPIKKGGGVFSMSNLQSLCWNCHSRKSAKEGSRWKNI